MEIKGEYWITDSGDIIFADGDVGDFNHEGYIIDSLASLIADEVDFPSKYGYEHIDPDKLIEFIYENELEDQIDPDSLKTLSGSLDARIFGIQKWNWKTVRGNYIETWAMSQNDLKTIASGLTDIIYEESQSDDDENEETEFYIYSHLTKQSKTFTLPQLKSGGITAAIQLPSQTDIGRKNDGWSKIAANQNRDIDIKNLHPYYQKRSFPLGDNVINFKTFMSITE